MFSTSRLTACRSPAGVSSWTAAPASPTASAPTPRATSGAAGAGARASTASPSSIPTARSSAASCSPSAPPTSASAASSSIASSWRGASRSTRSTSTPRARRSPERWAREAPLYEVYALKYGERDTTMCQFFYREHRHEPLTLHYFVWLIMGGPHPVLVDTGFRDDDAQARGIKNYVSPAEVVQRLGVEAADIPLCLISHLHYDHWAGHTLFPKAQFWIQKDEVAFWTGRHAGTPAFRGSANVPSLANLVTLNYANRIKIVDGDHEVLPGIRVYRVGGHTAGLQIVSVETDRGHGVLSSDASHFCS